MSNAPWSAEEALDMARHHIDAGEFDGLYLIGMPESTGVAPCIETPKAVAAMLGLQIMAGQMEHPDWLIFIGDTYHIELAVGEPHPGSLEAAFKAGDPRVTEMATALCLCPDGPSYQAVQRYVRNGDEIEWGEIETMPPDFSGALMMLMDAVLRTPYGAMPEAAEGLGMERVRLP